MPVAKRLLVNVLAPPTFWLVVRSTKFCVLLLVPPLAIGMTPVSEMSGVVPPDDASGAEAVTLVTATVGVAGAHAPPLYASTWPLAGGVAPTGVPWMAVTC